MEVHHHPHVEKKGFKEYFLEFLMIFLAVTLGFIAENIRENISEHSHAKEMAQSLIDDLKKDTTEIYFADSMMNDVVKSANAVISELNKPPSRQNDSLLQMDGVWNLTTFNFFDPQMGSYEQIKNSGALRYFPQQLATKMTSYEVDKNYLGRLTDTYMNYFSTELLPFCLKIENPRFFDAIQNKRPYSGVIFNPQLNDETLDMLYKQAYQIRNNYSWYVSRMNKHKQLAVELMNALKKVYHLKNQ
jgi:hypothetical protein